MTKHLTFSFFRDYQRYTGGHQKFHDYLLHTNSLPGTTCKLHVKGACPVMPNLFQNIDNIEYQKNYSPLKSDVVFLAGMDWKFYLPFFDKKQTIVNLVQHVKHGDKNHPLFSFLKYRALRICVSEAVKDAISPYANGNCVAIPMGHDIPHLKKLKTNDLYILSKKNIAFGKRIFNWACSKGLKVIIHEGLVTKEQVLNAMSESRLSLVLPNQSEGFFLPGIEAMALSDRVVVPDCIGNREYCSEYTNITLCEYDYNSCVETIIDGLTRLNTAAHRFEKFLGERVARSYDLKKERQSYHQVLKEYAIMGQ